MSDGNYSQFLLLRKGSLQSGGNLVASYHFGKHRIEVLAYTPAPYELPLQARGEPAINVAFQIIDSGIAIKRANLGLIQTESSLPFFHFPCVNDTHIAWIEQAIRSQYLHNVPFLDWAIVAGNYYLSDNAIEIEDQWEYDQIDAQFDSEEENDSSEMLFDNKVGDSFSNFVDTLDTDKLDKGDDEYDETDNEG